MFVQKDKRLKRDYLGFSLLTHQCLKFEKSLQYAYFYIFLLYNLLYYVFVTFDIIGSLYIFAFVDGTDLKYPLARPIYIRPPENNYKGPWIRRTWIHSALPLSPLLTCRHSEFGPCPSPSGYTFCPRSWILPVPWHLGDRWDAIHPESTVYHFPGTVAQQRNAYRWMI